QKKFSDKYPARADIREAAGSRRKPLTKEKGNWMQPMNRIPDPAEALAFFQKKVAFTTGPVEVNHLIEAHQDVVIVDVRAAEDYERGHVPGAISVPASEWKRPEGLRKDRLNIVYCYTAVCHLAAKACVEFAGQGFPVMEMDGGFDEWQENELEIEKGAGKRVAGEKAFPR